jgi:site-specific DNA recombinase
LIRAAIYIRVSTKEQTQNLSLSTQLRACQEYCGRQGWEVAEVFEDAGESAKTTDRPAFLALLEFCRNNKRRVQHVVVYNLTRFARSTHDHAVVRALLRGYGVQLQSATEAITDDPAGRLTENVIAAIAQFDNDTKAQRTKAGMTAALERGRWTWRAPLGYVNGNPRNGEPSLKPDADRAPLIRRAFELVAAGTHSGTEALAVVTAIGLLTRSGRRVTPQTFGAMLRNPIYAGWLQSDALGVRRARGDFEPLVPDELFKRVQAALQRGQNRVSHKLDHPDFPLRRFVICDVCSTPLTGSAPRGRSRSYRYYHCRRCKGVNVRAEALEGQFVELVESLRPRPEFMALFRAIVLDVWRGRCEGAGQVRRELEARLAELQRRESVLDNAYLFERRIDDLTYEKKRDEIREGIALARLAVEDARVEEIDVEGLLRYAEFVMEQAATLWTDASPHQRIRLQSVLFLEGLRFRDGRFGTAVTCLAFAQLPQNPDEESGLASPAGFEPAFWP